MVPIKTSMLNGNVISQQGATCSMQQHFVTEKINRKTLLAARMLALMGHVAPGGIVQAKALHGSAL